MQKESLENQPNDENKENNASDSLQESDFYVPFVDESFPIEKSDDGNPPKSDMPSDVQEKNASKKLLSKRTMVSCIIILLLIPLTIFSGIFFLSDRKYYLISFLVVIETMIPFFLRFEGKKPQARELIVIAVLSAIAVAGRAVFFMLPQFKPVVALVIIAGVCFGAESGFLVGAITAFVSNFMFGQGPWTPWQMFALGIIGFLAGILFYKGFLKKTKLPLSIFGGLATLVIYGGIMNPASILIATSEISWGVILTSYATGFLFDLILSLSTIVFLLLLANPMIEKLDRIKLKYGILDEKE